MRNSYLAPTFATVVSAAFEEASGAGDSSRTTRKNTSVYHPPTRERRSSDELRLLKPMLTGNQRNLLGEEPTLTSTLFELTRSNTLRSVLQAYPDYIVVDTKCGRLRHQQVKENLPQLLAGGSESLVPSTLVGAISEFSFERDYLLRRSRFPEPACEVWLPGRSALNLLGA
ncbi:hypothetical protein P7C70_g6021, partial [Phenoliferia sp. Uapishka_3]